VIKFKTLVVQNFLSYGAVPTSIQLDRAGTTLLLGEDLDNTSSGTGANGVGKTALLNALVYAVYDKPISSISKDNLINNVNKKNMSVTVEFEKDGHTYVISRNRKVKAGTAGNFTQLYIDGEDKTPAKDVNEEIEKIIGIPYELFVRIVAFSAIHESFLDLPSRHPTQANQTDIIEELFRLKTLSEKAELLKQQMKDTELSLKAQEEKNALLDKEHQRYAAQLVAAKDRVNRWEQQHKLTIESLNEELEKIKKIDVSEQRALFSNLELYEESIEKLMTEKDSLTNKLSEANKIRKEKKHELEHLDGGICPYCKQTYGINKKDRTNIEKQLTKAIADINEYTTKIDDLNDNIKDATTAYKKAKKQLHFDNIEDLYKLDSHIKSLADRIEETKQTINPHMEALKELENVKLDKKDLTAVNNLKQTHEHQSFLLKLLTKKDSFVRKALLNKNIPFLNQRLQTYLNDLGLPHVVEFTHEMTAKITQFGHEMDFGNLSNGQKARVNLALSFAFRDVLQSMHDYVNICLLDEVLDVGLDTVGVLAAAKMLKRKARDEKLALYIISHRDEIDSAFDRKMIVQLSGGFSSVRYQE
jgi:DNA repair exonuclease SbcCD ATPase subunit